MQRTSFDWRLDDRFTREASRITRHLKRRHAGAEEDRRIIPRKVYKIQSAAAASIHLPVTTQGIACSSSNVLYLVVGLRQRLRRCAHLKVTFSILKHRVRSLVAFEFAFALYMTDL